VKGNPILPKWEALARVLVPELYAAFRINGERSDGSVMPFMALLLQATTVAHRENDEQFLVNAYAFAHWCVAHPDRDLWNSAGVCFFERLFDDMPADEVAPWIASDAFAEISPLLEARFGAERARKIRKRFEARKETVERNYPAVIERAEREMSRAS
jgi:hypothetical protein